MNSRGGVPYKENENPFAFDTESAQTEGRRTSHETPFSFYTDDTTTAPAGAGNRDPHDLNSARLIRLQRWNMVLRLATSILCLATVILIVLSRQSKSNIPITGGGTGKGTATFKFSGSFKFFLVVHIVVLVYALLLSGLAFVMGRKGTGETTPATLMWPAFVLNMVAVSFLLLAFAAAVSVEVVARQGLSLGDILWLPICKYFGTFCFINEVALATSALSYLCLTASSCIDAYFIHRRKL